MEVSKQKPRRSLRDSVLRNPKNRAPQNFPSGGKSDDKPNFFKNNHFLGHFRPFFQEDNDDERFPSDLHKFPSFGDMDHFAKDFNDMVNELF